MVGREGEVEESLGVLVAEDRQQCGGRGRGDGYGTGKTVRNNMYASAISPGTVTVIVAYCANMFITIYVYRDIQFRQSNRKGTMLILN